MTTTQEKEFTTFSEAFDYCRECDKPVTVKVNGTRYKLFPSGKSLKVKRQ